MAHAIKQNDKTAYIIKTTQNHVPIAVATIKICNKSFLLSPVNYS